MATGSDIPVSVDEMNPLFIKGKCLNDCEVALTVGEEKTQLYVCKEMLGRSSAFFQRLFFANFAEKSRNVYEINDETTEDMVCFLNAIDMDPKVNKINGDSIELLICLSDKYQSALLQERLKQYIEANEPSCESATTILNWFICSKEYHMPKEVLKISLPGMACLSPVVLNENKEKIGLEWFAKLDRVIREFIIKTYDIRHKNIGVDNMICVVCQGKDSLPYEIWWCKGNHSDKTVIMCWGCVKKGHFNDYVKCCDKSDVYYKCRHCKLDPLNIIIEGPCLCARKMFEILLETAL